MSRMIRWAVPAVLLTALLVSPLFSAPVAAADVNSTVVAINVAWRLGSESGTVAPTITVSPGDVLRLRIENHENLDHTFTMTHFAVDETLAPGSSADPIVVFVNITTSAADNGRRWQFYCAIPGHATGADESRTGMVGWVQVATPTPPPTPGFEAVIVVAALAGAAVLVRLAPRRK